MDFDITKRGTNKQLIGFRDYLLDIQRQMGHRVSSRGWCYLLENAGIIDKDEFDKGEEWINACRRKGFLPIDFVAEDSARLFQGVEEPDEDAPQKFALSYLEAVLEAEKYYTPDWWREEQYYVQMVVEKVDLVTLFGGVCREYHVPIANSRGWSSMLQRAQYARRFAEHQAEGRKCVLLYFGDHDPDGLRIAENIRGNLETLKDIEWRDGTPGYDPEELIIDRFGLTLETIENLDLPWIDNLVTGGKSKKGGRMDLSSPRHPNHKLPYVQEYLADIGAQKCEANALLPFPDDAEGICRDAIEKYVGDEALLRFEDREKEIADTMEDWRLETGLQVTIEDAIKKVEKEFDDDEY